MEEFEECWKFDTFKYFMIGGVIFLLLLVITPNPVRDLVVEKFAEIRSNRKEHRRVSPSTLLGSDRGTYRDYWGAPDLYDAMTGYKCACHEKNKILREGRCWEPYDRDGVGLEGQGLPVCNTAAENFYSKRRDSRLDMLERSSEGYSNTPGIGTKLRGAVTHNVANAVFRMTH